MSVKIQSRAEIVLRSLSAGDRSKVDLALGKLRSHPPQQLIGDPDIRRLNSSEGRLYSLRASPKLRVIFSLHGEDYIVEDVAPKQRLDRVLSASHAL